MGVTLEVWRAAIGSFSGGRFSSKAVAERHTQVSLSLLTTCVKLCLLLSLLAIGGMEKNPGPETSLLACCHCDYETESAAKYVKHLSIHSLAKHFLFRCPLCAYKGEAGRALEFHINRSHPRGVGKTKSTTPTNAKCLVANCHVP